MDKKMIKQMRVLQRRVDTHLRLGHLFLGVQVDEVGFVQIYYHPNSSSPFLNYVTPRSNTSWIPTSHVNDGLVYLREFERIGRVCYADKLFLSNFSNSLVEIGMKADCHIPIWSWEEGLLKTVSLPEGYHVHAEPVSKGNRDWWHWWEDDNYKILSTRIEPLLLKVDEYGTAEEKSYYFFDIKIEKDGHVIGALRMTIADDADDTAHIQAIASHVDADAVLLEQLLLSHAVSSANKVGCSLVFTTRDIYTMETLRDFDFKPAGSMIFYVDARNATDEDDTEGLTKPFDATD